MFDRWKLGGFGPGQGVASGAFKERFDDYPWLDIPVPGDVHRTLIAAGRIDDPFYDRNEEKCACTLSRVTDIITVRLGTFAGERVWEESSQIEVGPNESRPVRSWTDAELVGGGDSYLWVLSSKNFFPPNRQFFTAIKDLRRKPVRLEAECVPDGDRRLSVRLRAGQYTYFVYLAVPDETARYTDNYFDMEPSSERTVIVESRDKRLSPETLKLGWR